MPSAIDLIDLFRFEVSIYHNARVCGDWKLNAHSEGNTCFHVATQNGFQMTVPEQGEWLLETGDLVIFPQELPHFMSPLMAKEGSQESVHKGQQRHLPISQSQHVAGTSLLCGEVIFTHQGSVDLMNALPAVFIIRKGEAEPWLPNIVELIVAESLTMDQPSNSIINRLCELMFSYALSHFVEHSQQQSGILALLSHKKIAKAVKVIHQQPNYAWQLSSLAQHAGMSRTQFSQSFKQVSGWTPMQYLTWWRMQLAWSSLQLGERVAVVAEAVGYLSVAAFSRAFKAQFGINAAKVRQ